MRASLAIVTLALISAAGPAFAEKLTIAVSTPEIRIDSNFTGENITVFGVIERDAASVSRGASYEVAIVTFGPSETVVARRKDRILGIWANNASETIVAVPSFYAMNSSAPLASLAAQPILERYSIGFGNIGFTYADRRRVNAPAAEEFRDAFFRLKGQAGLYEEKIRGIGFIGDAVFRSTVWIPANAPIGSYVIKVYLFSGGALLAQAVDGFSVSKIGFEQFMFAAANEASLAYGLACVALALAIGWLGGVIFRRD